MQNSELEAPIIINQNQRPQSRESQLPFLLRKINSWIAPQNITNPMRKSINDTIIYNIAMMCYGLAKIIASAVIIASPGKTCNTSLVLWICLMLVHDIFFITSQILLIKAVASTDYESFEEENHFEFENFNQTQDVDEGPHVGVYGIIEYIEQQRDFLTGFIELNRGYYLIVYIYGLVLFFQIERGMCSENLVKLTTVYLILGTIYMFLPLIFLLLACLCVPVMLITLLFVGRQPEPENDSEVPDPLIEQLQTIKLNSELPGAKECAICMNTYTSDDNLIQLKCSPLHHFHADCIKKWLYINHNCPICRTQLQEMYKKKANRRRSRRNRTQNQVHDNPSISTSVP